jgi:hypothetical protein
MVTWTRQNLVVAVLAFGMGMVFHELLGVGMGSLGVPGPGDSPGLSGRAATNLAVHDGGAVPTNSTASGEGDAAVTPSPSAPPIPSQASPFRHGDAGDLDDVTFTGADLTQPRAGQLVRTSSASAGAGGGIGRDPTVHAPGPLSNAPGQSVAPSNHAPPAPTRNVSTILPVSLSNTTAQPDSEVTGSQTVASLSEWRERGRGMQVAAVVQGLGDAWYGYGNRSKCDPLPPLPASIPCGGPDQLKQPSQ